MVVFDTTGYGGGQIILPVVIVRGYDIQFTEEGSVQKLLRPEAEDLFR